MRPCNTNPENVTRAGEVAEWSRAGRTRGLMLKVIAQKYAGIPDNLPVKDNTGKLRVVSLRYIQLLVAGDAGREQDGVISRERETG